MTGLWISVRSGPEVVRQADGLGVLERGAGGGVKVQLRFDAGELPDFPEDTRDIRESDWTVGSIPHDLQDRRVVPGWLLVGRRGGRIDVSVDATLQADAPAAGQPSLGGVAVSLAIPTAPGDDLSIRLDLRDLQLPGAATPRTFTLKELVRLLEGGARAATTPAARIAAATRAPHAAPSIADPEEDIPDPLGLPLEGYRAIVSELDGWIQRLVSALFDPVSAALVTGET